MTAALIRNTMSDAEAETRINLAAAFRVANHLGWNDTIYNHIAARVPDEPDTFLMNPKGLGWHEVQARDLIKSDYEKNYLSPTTRTLAPAGFNFHSAILREMPHINCTLHVHAPAVVLVSCTEDGLKYYDQGSCALYNDLSYHDFEGLAQEEDEAPRIIADLGDNKALMMRNHGGLTVGTTIGEAFYFMQRMVDACQVQSQLLSYNVNVRTVPMDVVKSTKDQMTMRAGGKPYGTADWEAYVRRAEQIDPMFKALD